MSEKIKHKIKHATNAGSLWRTILDAGSARNCMLLASETYGEQANYFERESLDEGMTEMAELLELAAQRSAKLKKEEK